MDPFRLETWAVGEDRFSFVGKVEGVLLEGAFLARSIISGQSVRTYLLDDGFEIGDEVTLLAFSLTKEGAEFCAHQSCESRWFVRAKSCLEGVGKVRDLCAGLGGMGQGALAASFEVVGSNEIQAATCRVLGMNTEASLVHVANRLQWLRFGRRLRAQRGCWPASVASPFQLLVMAKRSMMTGPAPCQAHFLRHIGFRLLLCCWSVWSPLAGIHGYSRLCRPSVAFSSGRWCWSWVMSGLVGVRDGGACLFTLLLVCASAAGLSGVELLPAIE